MANSPNPRPDPSVEQRLAIDQSTVQDSQIGGQAGRDLTQNHGSGNVFKDVTLNVFQTSAIAAPQSAQDYRNRQILFNKVRHYWIDAVLDRTLDHRLQFQLELENHPQAIDQPFGPGGAAVQEPEPLPTEVSVASLFDSLGTGRTLLILGAPGAGKTTALLQLARDLIAQANQERYDSLPVILNLSDWAPRQPFVEWVQAELHAKYQVPRAVGKAWLEAELLCLLLDGLDEVRADRRAACVEALNDYHRDHAPEIVVCCREQEYSQLPNRLNFQRAVYLRPLSPGQIEASLRQLPEAAGLGQLLHDDPTLRELAQTPLLLSLMVKCYQGVTDMPAIEQVDDRRQQLLANYINQMVQRYEGARAKGSRALSRSQLLSYLQHLAQHMVQQSQSVFLIEQMQPNWLGSPFYQQLYSIVTKASLAMLWGGTHAALLAGHSEDVQAFNGLLAGQAGLLGLLAGLLYGVIAGSLRWLTTDSARRWPRRLLHGLLLGALFAPVFGWVYDLNGAITYGLIYALGGIWIYDAMFQEHIDPADRVQWSRRRFGINALLGVLIGLALYLGTQTDLLPSLVFGLLSGIVFFGFEKQHRVSRRSFPNQGIWRSLANSLGFFVLIGAVTGVLLALLQNPVSGVVNGIILGLLAALFGGQGSGITCIKHFVLRLLLWHQGKIPWNYAQFLNWGCRLSLLQRVGGGYSFIHRLLLEYLAG
ncbi:MAG: NACHT domain-containing protein [Nodosilinea sp.]